MINRLFARTKIGLAQRSVCWYVLIAHLTASAGAQEQQNWLALTSRIAAS
jgi:hypothetical protein